MLRISNETPSFAAAVRDAEFEEASVGWASDTSAITMLREKSAYSVVDMDDIASAVVSGSGQMITPESALRVAAVFACRRVISEDVAKLPRLLKQTTIDAQGRRKTRTIWPAGAGQKRGEERLVAVARVLSIEPNEWMTPIQFYEWLVGTAVTQKAAYALPTYNENDELVELLPLLPGAVTVQQRSDWSVEYQVHGYGLNQTFRPGQIIQLTGPVGPDLLQGYSVSSLAREAIGLAQAIEQSQARFHKNDMRPSGMLTTKLVLRPDQRNAIRDDWMKGYGPGGTGGIAVLDNEFDYKALTVTSTDAQTLENRDHQVSEICRYFRVFPQLIGHSGGVQGYGTFEQAINSHVSLTLTAWVERTEQALMKGLLTPEERQAGYHIKIDMDALARGTFGDRMNAYEKGVKIMLTPNEIRELEDRDPIDDPAMDRVQLLANNTGLQQGTAKPVADPQRAKLPADLSTSKPAGDA